MCIENDEISRVEDEKIECTISQSLLPFVHPGYMFLLLASPASSWSMESAKYQNKIDHHSWDKLTVRKVLFWCLNMPLVKNQDKTSEISLTVFLRGITQQGNREQYREVTDVAQSAAGFETPTTLIWVWSIGRGQGDAKTRFLERLSGGERRKEGGGDPQRQIIR